MDAGLAPEELPAHQHRLQEILGGLEAMAKLLASVLTRSLHSAALAGSSQGTAEAALMASLVMELGGHRRVAVELVQDLLGLLEGLDDHPGDRQQILAERGRRQAIETRARLFLREAGAQ